METVVWCEYRAALGRAQRTGDSHDREAGFRAVVACVEAAEARHIGGNAISRLIIRKALFEFRRIGSHLEIKVAPC